MTEDGTSDLAGIISERDFVKALATQTPSTSLVRAPPTRSRARAPLPPPAPRSPP